MKLQMRYNTVPVIIASWYEKNGTIHPFWAKSERDWPTIVPILENGNLLVDLQLFLIYN